MELNEAILNRRSIRLFLPDPVPRETITKIVDMARWVPSWGNTQPWEIVVADGETTKTLSQAFEAEVRKGNPPRPDMTMPIDFPEPYKGRYMGLGRTLLTSMGITRDDAEARSRHWINMYHFFGAPACIYFVIDKALNEQYSCLDLGFVGVTICHLAVQEGLGTIFLAASMHYPDIVRSVLHIPDTKKIVIGLAIGTPHPTDPASVFRSERDPVEKILRFA